MVLVRNLPNIITSLRIAATVVLLFIRPFSVSFYIIYTLAGVSDIVDGWIARRMKLVSELGAKLDSIADLMFYAVMLIRILPVLLIRLPIGIWIAIGAILAIRAISYTLAAVKFRRFASQHTYMNKITGIAVFTVPYIINLSFYIPICWAICLTACAASAEELVMHIRAKEYNSQIKTIFKT